MLDRVGLPPMLSEQLVSTADRKVVHKRGGRLVGRNQRRNAVQRLRQCEILCDWYAGKACRHSPYGSTTVKHSQPRKCN